MGQRMQNFGDDPTDLETDFRQRAERMPRLAWVADADGAIYWYNKRWFDYTGTTLDEVHGWGWQSVHHPDHVDRVVDRINKAFAAGNPWEDLFPLRAKDGRYSWFLSEAQPVRDETGTIRFWFGTNMDVTDQIDEIIDSDWDWSSPTLPTKIEIKPGATLETELANSVSSSQQSPLRSTRRTRILVVEDEPMTALDLEMRLSDAGYDVIGPAMTIASAERELQHGLPDIALLDTNLGGTKSYDLAEKLVDQGVPVVFCTGYEELEDLPDRLSKCPVVSKPFRDSVLMASITAASRRVEA
ncbi:PAS domain-containing protein [Henriciella marina]|uniref:PAS domain-containing protein n=1 Tax=Henriciella marina TaxID=453851 RepID=UPI000A04DE36|nr:PAS domain-containing protein [Henriciella marina]